ncbi:MAG: hypothetical protein ACRDRL_25690 [Sciscionella sp.]
MRRVSVVGTSGAGKSTLAAELARVLDADFLELDSVFHQPGWVPLAREEFRRRVAAAVAGERWVIDGNYTSQVKDLVWARADTVVWLDLARRTVMRRITRRSPSSPGRGRLMPRPGPSWRRPGPIRGTVIWSSFG